MSTNVTVSLVYAPASNGLPCVYNHWYIENGGCQQICITDRSERQRKLDYGMEADISSCIFNYSYINNGGCDQYLRPALRLVLVR